MIGVLARWAMLGDRVVCIDGPKEWGKGVYIITKLQSTDGLFSLQSERGSRCIKAYNHEIDYAPTGSSSSNEDDIEAEVVIPVVAATEAVKPNRGTPEMGKAGRGQLFRF